MKPQQIFSTVSTLYYLNKGWNKCDKVISKFMTIIDELGSYDQEISDEEKKTKLLRMLPKLFEPIAMV